MKRKRTGIDFKKCVYWIKLDEKMADDSYVVYLYNL